MDARTGDLYLSAVTVAEVCDGIAKLKRTGSISKAVELGSWLESSLQHYGERVLPFDSATAQLAGAFMDKARAAGHTPGFPDIAIAATAAIRDLTVLTRNLRHFIPLGSRAIDPFDTLPN